MMCAKLKQVCTAVVLALSMSAEARCGEPIGTGAEFREFLDRWEESAAAAERSQVRFRRFTYDRVFGTEKRAIGTAYFEGTQSARWDDLPADIPEGETSRRFERHGKPFQLKSDIRETWLWTPESVLQINPACKTVDQFPCGRRQAEENVKTSGLTFWEKFAAGLLLPPSSVLGPILHPDADQLLKRFEFAITREDDLRLWIHMKPRREQDAADYKHMDVILDRRAGRIVAVRFLDPAGNTETVYTFSEWKVNEEVDWDAARERNVDGPPLDPDLTGYRINAIQLSERASVGTPLGDAASGDPLAQHIARITLEAHVRLLAFVVGLWWQTPASVQEFICELPAKAARVPRWLAGARLPLRWRLLVGSCDAARESFLRSAR